MSYRVHVASSARRYIRRLERRASDRVVTRLRDLADNPYEPRISKPLHGRLSGLRSSDIDWLRILYDVDDSAQLVSVLDIGPRGDIYKR